MKYFKFKSFIIYLALAMAIPPAWADETIVCDGSATTEYLPVYGYNFDAAQHNQMIYPASELQDLPSGAYINSITFYPTAALVFSGSTVTFKVGNATGTSPYSVDGYGYASDPIDASSFTQVAIVTPSGDNPWVITFSEPLEYSGGDLIIDVVSDAATYGSNTFNGKDLGAYYGYYAYGSYTKKAITILPKMGIDYDAEAKPYAAKATPGALAFSKLLPAGQETLNITLKNTGSNPITPTLSGLEAPFSTTYSPAQLAAGEQVTIPITFSPTAAGSYSATLTIGAVESSDVAAQVTITGTCSTDVTVEDGTSTNGYLPLYYPSYYTQKNQMIYPAADLTALVGKSITGLTFYSPGMTFSGTYNLAVGVTDQTSYSSSPTPIEGLTQVVTGHTATNGATEFATTFDTPFEYNGGNLVIQIEVTDKGTYSGSAYVQSQFYGTDQSSYTGYYSYDASYGTYSYARQFLPKATFDYVTTDVTPTLGITPESVTMSDEAAGTFTVTGSNVTGSINAALASNTDWYMTPETLSNAGGDLTVTYTGRALSASNTVTVTAADAQPASAQVNYTAQLYIVTDGGVQGQWNFNSGTAMSYNDGVYTAQFTATADNTFILFARKLGDGVTWNTRYVFGPSSDGDWWLPADGNGTGYIDLQDDDPIKIQSAGVYTITLDASNGMMTITKYVAPEYEVTVSPDGGALDFGNVTYNEGSATRSITVTSTGTQPVTPTLSGVTAPFSTDYEPTTLNQGESVTINITFTPTEEGTFNGTATLTLGNSLEDRTFTLTGKGVNQDVNDHSATYDYTYTWTDDNGAEHTSNLLETATDPNQIIAMLREIYTNKEIPGNKLRGYTQAGQPESLTVGGNDAFAVNYSAVGQLNSSLQYTDTYGWNIPTQRPVLSLTKGNYTYNYMDPTEYEPEQEGLTLIMVEMKDGANYSGSNYYSFTNATLKEKVANTFKSARIITSYKKSGSGEEAGTLFKIDADKLNRFFFLAKGQLRLIDHSQAGEKPWTSTTVVPYPSMRVRGSSYTFTDNTFNTSSGSAVLAPFEHMFEQFSPNQASSSTDAMTDVYQNLVNMESYEVVHDCVSIPFVGGNHEFNMYGVESTSDDCQDVRDMMFFVPDYRMKYWAESQYSFGDATRDPNNDEKFVNYNRDHRPTLGLYVIRQNEITGEQQDGADVYDLHLSWESNLLDFLPGDEAEYNLYRVETDEQGNKTYVFVATIDPGVTTYVDQVPMQEHGQQVTYVVQGQDTEHFLSLQMSNEESYIIPGTDKSEIFNLSPKTDDYSRFDPLSERNYYANQLKVTNNVGTNVKGSYLGNGAKFTFYRTPSYGAVTDEPVPVFVATSDGNGTLTIQALNQREDGLYHEWINMVNPTTVTYSVDANDNVTFNGFTLYDNFWESVADNEHPSLYIYEVELEASTTIADTQGTTAHSNQIGVFVHKTDMDVLGYSKEQIDADTDHALATGTRYISEEVKYSSKTEILRYDNYRWNQQDENLGVIIDWANSSRNQQTGGIVTESDMEPTGQAGNQATEYTVKMDGVNSGSILIGQGQTKVVTYEDQIVEDEWGMYTYAPVVETFTSRSDYNTYGAPLQQTGVATFQTQIAQAEMSSDLNNAGGRTWTADGKVYTHYKVTLDMNELLIPVSDNDQLKDYDLYKVRVWRQVNPSLLREETFDKAGRNRSERVTATGEFLMEEVDHEIFSRESVFNTSNKYALGNNPNLTDFYPNWTIAGSNEVMATFGAQKLRENINETGVIDELPMTFIIRAYYTRTANLGEQGNMLRGVDKALDGKYYIAEYTLPYTLTSNNIVTGLQTVTVDRHVTAVTYYNVMGQPSAKPYDGVNIIVTQYSDGTTTTAKVVK